MLQACVALSLLLVAASAVPTEPEVSYEGYRVVRIIPGIEQDLVAVKAIVDDLELTDADIWLEPSHLGRPVDINVPPQMYQTLIQTLKAERLAYTIMIDDVQEEIDLEKARLAEDRSKRQVQDIVGAYVSYADVVSWLNNLASTNTKVTVQTFGKTVENRNMVLAKISKPSAMKKPIVFLEAGIHAREWVSPTTAIWMINQLATSTDADTTKLLDAADWYIVPVLNADGYEYTRATDRLWRKNRSVNSGTTCRGVDLNRNWNSHWMLAGSSSNPCAETYAGSAADSEPETKALRDYLLSIKTDIKFYMSIHSYSQLWLTPWAHKTAQAPDHAALMSVANAAKSAITAVYGTSYQAGPTAVLLYACSGDSADWAKETAGVAQAHSIELRDTGRNGFVLPANQILPTAIETWAGVKTAVKMVLNI